MRKRFFIRMFLFATFLICTDKCMKVMYIVLNNFISTKEVLFSPRDCSVI